MTFDPVGNGFLSQPYEKLPLDPLQRLLLEAPLASGTDSEILRDRRFALK